MKTKNGISLVVLVITIIVTVIITGIIIVQISNGISAASTNDFAAELSTIQDKIKEYYVLVRQLPVKVGEEYTSNELKSKLTDAEQQELLESEITTNRDNNNTFFIVNLDLINVETDERGKSQENTDIFLVASNTLNVYYLKGVELDGIMKFSLATLVEKNTIEYEQEQLDNDVTLDTQLSLMKNTNVWTNEISITVKNSLQASETLKYSIGGGDTRDVPANNIIAINSINMTEAEKTLFNTNKQVTVSRLVNGSVTETKAIDISNLDIISPNLGTMEMTDTSNTSYNLITINSADEGGSEIKCMYYDYNNILVNNLQVPYYSDRSKITVSQLMSFGKITSNGRIKLDKNIKSISVIAIDNAGNISDITTYTIEDTYLISK